MQKTATISLTNVQIPQLDRWVYAFIILHIVLWTLAPACVRYTLPMDSIEGSIWGHQLEWGYDKHPFLNGWLIALATKLGASGWGIYLFSQLSVASCIWAVWEFGKKITTPLYAFIAVLLLESIQYYNLHAIDLNNNTLEPGFWALTILFFYLALQKNKLQHWMLTGLFAGLSLMTKYYAALLFLPMFAFMFVYPHTRQLFKKINLYLGLLVFVVIIAPHTIWLFSHHFTTFDYAIHRVETAPHLINHIFYPLQFLWQQFEVFIPALVVLSALFIGQTKNQIVIDSGKNTHAFDKTFLLFIALGPVLLTILPSLLFGTKLRAGWGQPLLTYWGLMILIWFKPFITQKKLTRFVIALMTLFACTVLGYCIALMRATEPSSANFPGKNIAVALTQEWNEKYHSPLIYVVGPRELAGNIAFHSKDKPSVYIEAEKNASPWIDEEKLKQTGAIFVWDPTEKYQVPFSDIKQRFPNIETPRKMYFAWMRNKAMPPVEISVSFLAPELSQSQNQSLLGS